MTTHFSDEQLAAYALGELEASECAAMETFLKADEAARRNMAEFQTAARWAAEAFSPNTADSLTDSQRRAILSQARTARVTHGESDWRRVPYRRWGMGLALAAGVLLVAGAVVFFPRFHAKTAPELSLGYGVSAGRAGERNIKADFTDNYQAFIEQNGQDFFADGRPARLNAEPRMYGGGGGGGMGGGMGGFGGAAPGGISESPSSGGETHVAWLFDKLSAEAPADGEKLADSGNLDDATDLPKESPPSPSEIDPARYLIKNATLNLEVEDARVACERLTNDVVAAGGYVSNLDEQTDGLDRRHISLQVRVPAGRLDGAMTGLESLGRVLLKRVNTEDITEEYVDTDARARNYRKTEERLLEHLDKAFLIENTLKIETELSRVREQIERLEGRLRFLGHRVRFSTIAVSLQEKPKADTLLPVQTFSSAKVVSEALRALIEFAQTLWERAIWLAVWSPVWGILMAVAFLIWRGLRKRIRARKEKSL